MRARLLVVAALIVSLATMSVAALSTATVPTRPAPLDPAAFALIAGSDLVAADPAVPEPVGSSSPAPVIVDFGDSDRSFAPRPEPRLSVAARVIVAATPRPRATAAPPQVAPDGTTRARGNASWYCKTGVSVCHHAYPGGMYAAAGPALRVGKWRGRVVKVCGGGTCVTVKLIDWCACPGTRVIDLYSDAFRRLAPLSKGTINVTVTW